MFCCMWTPIFAMLQHEAHRNLCTGMYTECCKEQRAEAESMLQCPRAVLGSVCVTVFSPHCNLKKKIRTAQCSCTTCCTGTHRRLSASAKYQAAMEVSAEGATSVCPGVTYIFLPFLPPSRRNLFEFMKTGDRLLRASCVRLGQAGATRELGKGSMAKLGQSGLCKIK